MIDKRIVDAQRVVGTQWRWVRAKGVLLWCAAILAGYLIKTLMRTNPPMLLVGAAGGLLFLVLFLERPDYGLFLVLIVRAFSDLSVIGRQESGMAALLSPNVGLSLMLFLGGGLFILMRSVPLLSLPGGALFVLLLITGLAGTFAGGFRGDTPLKENLYTWVRISAVIVPYALTAFLFRTPQRIQTVVTVLALAFATPALYGLYQIVSGHTYYVEGLGISRIQGTFVHSNAFGIFLVVFFAIFFCQALVQSGFRKLLAVAIAGACVILLAATYARVAWAGALVIVMVTGFLTRRPLVMMLPLLAIVVGSAMPTLSGRVTEITSGRSSLESRSEIWQRIYPAWLQQTHDPQSTVATVLNRLAGAGPASVGELTSRSMGTAVAAHNDYLTVLLNYGIFGLCVYLVLYMVLLFSAYRTWQRAPDKVMAAIPLSFLALTVAFLVMGLTDNVFGAFHSQLYFWTLAGLTVAVSKISFEESPDERSERETDLPRERRPAWNGRGARLAARPSGRGLAVR